jgi:glycosyltransferase involved in cell wall biosynthesis
MSTHSNNRILHIPRRFSLDEWGGTEAVIKNICLAQSDMGMRPEIHTSLALSKTKSEQMGGVPIFRYPYCYPFLGLDQTAILQLDKKGGNLLSWSLYRALRRAKNVRIFHAHVTKRTGASVLKAAQLAKRPCVVTLHGNMFDVPESEAADVVAPQQGHFEWGKLFGAYFGSRNLLENVDAILCVGYSEYIKASAALGKDRVHFLPNGVHSERLKALPGEREKTRAELGFTDESFLIGCISRIDPQKNQALLIKAFCELAAKDSKLGLIICGPKTNDVYYQKLVTQIEQSAYSDRIRLRPPVEPDSPAHRGLFAALDCFTLPSRHEPFGIVVLEAWAAGCPVIASNVGGLQKLIHHNTNGLHFESGDVNGLVVQIKRMREDEHFRQQSVSAGQKDIAENYTWSQVCNQLENIYQSVEAKYT